MYNSLNDLYFTLIRICTMYIVILDVLTQLEVFEGLLVTECAHNYTTQEHNLDFYNGISIYTKLQELALIRIKCVWPVCRSCRGYIAVF